MTNNDNYLGRILKQRRLLTGLTLRRLGAASGLSSSHLGRIERGERFPSGHVLRKVARSLDFQEGELFTLAGYLSPRPSGEEHGLGRLDPYVSSVLSQESVEVQRAVIGILSILKSIARAAETSACRGQLTGKSK